MNITLNKTILYLPALLILATGCRHAEEEPIPAQSLFRDFSVSIGGEDATRSLISVEAEKFREAYLFAFDATTGEILSYPGHAGDLEGSRPVAIHTMQKTFNWALPVGKAMDIWAVVNPGDGSVASYLEACSGNPSLTEVDLFGDRLVFTCESGTRLKELDATSKGIPMAGRMDGVTLGSTEEALSVRVRRLFARYDIRFDTSGYTGQGYTVKSTYLMASKSNTEVPFFWDGGYAQSDYTKLATVDRSTESDLRDLDDGREVTLYFLENCQGDRSGASSWSTVYRDLGPESVKLCSYMEVGVNVSRASDGTDASFVHRIYLGKGDMKSNFDVERNLHKTILLHLKPEDGSAIPGGDVDGFLFTGTESLSVAPGGSVTIPFETSISGQADLVFSILGNGSVSSALGDPTVTGFGRNNQNRTAFGYGGSLTLTASADAAEGTYEVVGGDASRTLKDIAHVTVEDPLVLEDIDLTCDVTSGNMTITGHGDDMNVHVEQHDGNECYLRFSARVKYRGQWHDVLPSFDPLVQLWITGMGDESSRLSTLWVPPGNSSYSMHEWYMPGDVDVVKVYFNNEAVMTFSIYYN